MTTDIRYPATLPLSAVTEKLDSFGVDYVIDNYQAPLYNDPKGKLISTLMGVYSEVTGKTEAPIAIGGGTYARALKCGCAFGPELPGSVPTIHQANEFVTFDCIKLMSEIYYKSIKAIACPANGEGETRVATIRWTFGEEAKESVPVEPIPVDSTAKKTTPIMKVIFRVD